MLILVVCTGNICRSPMAATFLEARLSERGIPAGVLSAGVLEAGRKVSDHGVAVMAGRGHDTSRHRSRQISSDLIRTADLVIGLAREHVREVVATWPGAFASTFTLKELVRRGEQVGPRPDGMALADWLAKLGSGRRDADLAGASDEDDVPDPIGRPLGQYEETADELDGLTRRLARLLAGGD